MAEYDLLNKTELSIKGIQLENTNLNQIANVVAEVLGIERNDLLVTDVRDDNLVMDILQKGLDAENILGKEGELLQPQHAAWMNSAEVDALFRIMLHLI